MAPAVTDPLSGPTRTALAKVEIGGRNLSAFEFTAQARASNLGKALFVAEATPRGAGRPASRYV